MLYTKVKCPMFYIKYAYIVLLLMHEGRRDCPGLPSIYKDRKAAFQEAFQK